MGNDSSRSGRKRKRKSNLLLIIFLAIFLFSGAMLIRELREAARNRDSFKELAGMIDGDAGVSTQDGRFKATDNSKRFAALLEANPDFIGWLRIDGTKIDYPVMCTPDDPEYYLHRSFEREYSVFGVPFMDYACTIHSNNIYIYGHNMRNGSMFASLHKYKDEDFWKAHPRIYFDTLEYSGVYEIIAVYAEKVHLMNETDVFRFYNYAGDLDPEQFENYVQQVKASALYDTGADAEYGDMLINLVTCSYHASNGRLIVTAKRVE